jgi:site-specific DNA-methyltransferase (adenine-specific)
MTELNQIYHKNCLDFMLEDIEPGSIDLIVTSPPYADMRDYTSIPPDEYVEWFLPFAHAFYRVLKENGVFVLNIRNNIVDRARHTYVYDLVHQLRKQVGFDLIEDIIWDKVKVLPNSKGRRPMDVYEFAFVFGKGKDITWNVDYVRTPYGERTQQRYKTDVKVRWNSIREDRGDRKIKLHPLGAYPKNIIRIPSESTRTGHPAPYPVEFAEWFVRAYSNPGELVYDPFAGGGTTAVAAQKNGRNWILTEIHEEYIVRAQTRIDDTARALF